MFRSMVHKTLANPCVLLMYTAASATSPYTSLPLLANRVWQQLQTHSLPTETAQRVALEMPPHLGTALSTHTPPTWLQVTARKELFTQAAHL